MNRLAWLIILAAVPAISCANQSVSKPGLETVPRTMRLVTVAKSTSVYGRPTLAAKELKRLPPGSPLVFLEKGGEDRIIGAVFSSWFKVRLEDGSRGWVFAGHLANARANRPPYSYKKLIGAWTFPGNAALGAPYPARVELKRDARFDFNGWRIKEFQSHGAWIYDNLENKLTLRFYDKREEWNDWFSTADRRLFQATAGYGKHRPTVHMRVEGPGSSAARFNLLGTSFEFTRD